VFLCIICMYVCINLLSRIHNSNLISAYFGVDSRDVCVKKSSWLKVQSQSVKILQCCII
jgi:hypothetical protein